MIERIGKVTLEDRLEGKPVIREPDATEKRLLEILTLHPLSEYLRLLAEQPSWPLLKQFSPLRENLMSWIPLPAGARVLELGSECGPVTGAFLGKGAEVVSVDASPVSCRINALRHQEMEGLSVLAADPLEVLSSYYSSLDLIAWSSAPVLRRASGPDDPLYSGKGNIRSDASFPDILLMIRRALKPAGILCLAMENPLGMKYFSGRPEEATGKLFESIEGFSAVPAARTYSRRELLFLAEETGYDAECYYPYPDHWLPERIYSDRYLPREGELTRNWQCFDSDRVLLFDEEKAFDSVIRAGLFPDLSNAFLLVLCPKGGPSA